jgi:hypothetical protein
VAGDAGPVGAEPGAAETAGPGREGGRLPLRPVRRNESERGLRGLVGAGPSQVGVSGALRARDAARPRPEDLAAAERDLVIVRRNYVPPEPSRTDG